MLSIYTHPIFYKHDTGIGHPESSARIDAAMEGVDRAGFAARTLRDAAPHADTERIIAKVHSADYERELSQPQVHGHAAPERGHDGHHEF